MNYVNLSRIDTIDRVQFILLHFDILYNASKKMPYKMLRLTHLLVYIIK